MKKIELTIEIGSSYIVIAQSGNGIVLREPSLLAYDKNSGEVIATGNQAKKMIGKTTSSVIIFSPVENGIIKEEKYANILLDQMLKKVISSRLFTKIDVNYIVRTGLTEDEILVIKNVLYSCGASSINFVNSTIAGLIGSGVNISNPTAYLSLHIGGGSTNISVVSMNNIIAGISISFGGIEMDEAIRDYMIETAHFEMSLTSAEKVKEECGSLYLQDTTNMEVNGIDTVTKMPRTEIIYAQDVRTATAKFFDNIVSSIEYVLNDCSPDIVADLTPNGIYVTGGVANIVGLENYLSKKLNLPVHIQDSPENCVF